MKIPEETLWKIRSPIVWCYGNLYVIKLISELIIPTFGPMGRSNKGIDVLEQHEIDHPVFSLIFQKAKQLDQKHGDGVASFVLISSELYHRTVDLAENGIDPSTIVSGYNMAIEKAKENVSTVSHREIIPGEETGTRWWKRKKKIAVTAFKENIPGGGAADIELAQKLRDYSVTVGGREQLAIMAFADAVEAIPKSLAKNAGLDPIDMLVALRSAYDSGEKNAGLDVLKGEPADMVVAGVHDDAKCKIDILNFSIRVVEELMHEFEKIREHKIDIFDLIETRISTVTPVSNIKEVGKYAECPYCGSNIRDTFYELGGIVRCDKCGAFHHKECFEYYGRKCGSSSCKLRNT
ncbi:MAG: hypothetical protein N2V75_05030 [Methanophagales archaeon]|nr:hypothetical protein [Methanophagales archaeon]